MTEIRIIFEGEDEEKFTIVKDWLKEKTNTGVIRNLINEKYQEIKRLHLLGKNEEKVISG